MKYLSAILDALADFVRRNPLVVLLLLVLALGAPALLRGIALFILYFLMGILVLILVGVLLLRWHMNRIRRQMEQQFGASENPRNGFGFGPDPRTSRRRNAREGDVHVYRTPDAPEKRVAENVGDYVDFEEEKN